MNSAISVVGLGYVGLCTAVCFASKGFKVYGVDIDQAKLDSIREGHSPYYEPQLERHLNRGLKTHLFRAIDEVSTAVKETEVTFISVGTPSLDDGSIDLSYVKQSSAAIGMALKEKTRRHLVVMRSTVVPTTCDSIVRPLIERNSGKQCGSAWGLCMNPEFLKEGSAIHDTMYPDRVVIGEYDERSGSSLTTLYRRFLHKKVPILRTSLANAELAKYANNAFLAMKVSFANMIANLCETLPTADVTAVTHAIGLDRRIGTLFLNAGLGYGGSCFPKDINALIAFAKQQKVDLPLVGATAQINGEQPLHAIKLGEKLVGNLSGKRVAVLGLAFKPDTDDMREAVSIRIVRGLLERNASVVVYDPKAIPQARKIFGETVTYARSAKDCIRGSDLCILVTEWESYKRIKPSDFAMLMKHPAVVDGRRLLASSKFDEIGFEAVGLGRHHNPTTSDAAVFPPAEGEN